MAVRCARAAIHGGQMEEIEPRPSPGMDEVGRRTTAGMQEVGQCLEQLPRKPKPKEQRSREQLPGEGGENKERLGEASARRVDCRTAIQTTQTPKLSPQPHRLLTLGLS